MGMKRLNNSPEKPMVTDAALITIARPVVRMTTPSPLSGPVEQERRLHAERKWIA